MRLLNIYREILEELNNKRRGRKEGGLPLKKGKEKCLTKK